MNTAKKGLIGLIASFLMIALDQLTKYAAIKLLKGQNAVVIWKGVFELSYLENRGAAFGILQGQKWPLIIVTIVLLICIAYIFLKRIPFGKRYWYLNLIAVLFFAGAMGNFIDRVIRDYVVDFFSFILIQFPIFNIADIYVTIAAFGFIILGLFYYKDEDFEKIIPSKKKEQ